jgi:hypothetical protein
MQVPTATLQLHPTVFFTQTPEGLEQVLEARATAEADLDTAILHLQLRGRDWHREVELAGDASDPTRFQARVGIPDRRVRERVHARLSAPGIAGDPLLLTTAWERPVTPHYTVHLVLSCHFDPGYTDLPSRVMDAFIDDLRAVITYCRETEGLQEDLRFRYTIEQSWILRHFLERTPETEHRELLRLLREGRIEVNLLTANLTTELLCDEEMLRAAADALEWQEHHGIPVRTAEHNDIPGLSWGLITTLARAGIEWFLPAFPDYFRWGTEHHTFWDESTVQPGYLPRVFLWEGVTGGRVRTFVHDQGAGGEYDPGLANLEAYLDRLQNGGYPYEQVRYQVKGAVRDNAPATRAFQESAVAWQERWAFPRVVCSTNTRFTDALARELPKTLPVFRGDLPGTDYPIGALSTARETGVARNAQAGLNAGQTLAALATAVAGSRYPSGDLARAGDHLVRHDEHVWGVAYPGGPGQAAARAEKAVHAYTAAGLAHEVRTRAAHALADRLAPRHGVQILVLNPLPWERGHDLVTIPVQPAEPCGRPLSPAWDRPHGLLYGHTCDGHNAEPLPDWARPGNLRVRDLETGALVAHQFRRLPAADTPEQDAPERVSMSRWNPGEALDLLIQPPAVPGLGYRILGLEPGAETGLERPDPRLRATPGLLENERVRIRLDDNGRVLSITDRHTGQEWSDPEAAYPFAALVGRDRVTHATVQGRSGGVEVWENGPLCASVLIRGQLPGCPVTVTCLRVHANTPEIDVAVRLLKDTSAETEVFLAFPFLIPGPAFTYDTALAPVRYLIDQLPGSNSDYTAVQDWVQVVGSDSRAVLWTSRDTPIVEFGRIHPGYVSQAHHGATPDDFDHEFLRDPDLVDKGHLYAMLLGNNFRTNFSPWQCGDLLFRFRVRLSPDTPAATTRHRHGRGFRTPLETAVVPDGRGTDTSLSAVGVWCTLTPESLSMTCLRLAGSDLILRLREIGGRDVTGCLTLHTARRIRGAWLCSLTGRPEQRLPFDGDRVRVSLRAHDIATVRVEVEQGS